MKKRILILSMVLVACAFASASNWTFGFESTGHGLYCDYVQINNNSFSSVVYGGVHNLEIGCDEIENAAIAGFAGNLSAKTNPHGFATKGVIYGDSIYIEFCGVYYFQWTVAQNLKCSEKKFGWIGIADYASNAGSGFIFGDNYGYLSCNIPGKNGKRHNGYSTIGKKAR